MLRIIFWSTLMLWPLLSFSQKKVGDFIEPVILERELANAVPSIPPEAIRQKIVIIDFWGSQCGSCIKAMPKMLALQKKYKDEVIMLYATEQDSEGVNKVFTKRPDFKKYALPMIRDASFLANEFPHYGIPHVIWIGKDSRIKAITSSDVVTEQNIETLINTNTLNLKTKSDILDFNDDLPLLKHDRVHDSSIIRSSILLSGIEGFGSRHRLEITDLESVRFLALNSTIALTYTFLYTNQVIIFPFEIRFRFLADKECERYLSNRDYYSYEYINSIAGTNNRRAIEKTLIKDLDRQLSVRSSIRKQELDCYWMNIPENLASTADSSYTQDRIDSVTFINQPASIIAEFIQSHYRPDRLIRVPPNKNRKITMQISKTFKDFEELSRHLRNKQILFEMGKVTTDVIYLEKGTQ